MQWIDSQNGSKWRSANLNFDKVHPKSITDLKYHHQILHLIFSYRRTLNDLRSHFQVREYRESSCEYPTRVGWELSHLFVTKTKLSPHRIISLLIPKLWLAINHLMEKASNIIPLQRLQIDLAWRKACLKTDDLFKRIWGLSVSTLSTISHVLIITSLSLDYCSLISHHNKPQE